MNMSTNLFWLPRVRKGKILSKDLRRIIDKKYGYGEFVLDHSDLGYLEGLKDSGIEDADKLIEAISKHDCISLYQE